MAGAYVLVVGYAASVSRFDAATGALAWTTDGVQATCTPIPVLFDDGHEVAYVGTHDGKLVTLDATSGTVLDEVTLLTGDGSGTDTIVVGLALYQGYLCAAIGTFLVGCDAAKGPLWHYPMQGLAWGNPAVVDEEGLIVAGSFDAAVHAVAFDGTAVWTATQDQFFSTVPVVYRGIVYVAAGTKVCGLDLQGQLLWTEVGNAANSYQRPHVLDPREGVFYASGYSLIEARRLDDGGLVWEQPLPHSPGPLARDGADLYYATHTISPDQPYLFKHVGADQMWQSELPVGDPGHLPSTPVPDRDDAEGNVFLTSTDGNVYAFRKRDGTLVWQEDSGGISGVPPALVHPVS